MIKVLHLEYYAYSKNSLESLNNQVALDCLKVEDRNQYQSILKKTNYDYIFTKIGLYTGREEFDLQDKLKGIITPTTGLNHIDLDLAKIRNVKIISLQNEIQFLESIKSTAEHTWGLILAVTRNLPSSIAHVKCYGWDRKLFMADELDSKTIGIIGFGRLGKIISNYAKAFNMRILAYDDEKIEKINNKKYVEMVKLDYLLENSDIVVLMINYKNENKNFFDKEKFSMMKKGSYFINTSRGEMVDEKDLLLNLKNKKLKGAALDVLKNDSGWGAKIEGINDLIDFSKKNSKLIITPHMGGYGIDSIRKTRDFITDKFLKELKL
jgi:D-3-phosphoglycerate dehydrogenase / 2-oxoglutarate reductase